MNQIIIIGNLVADPEARTTPSNKNLCSFRVAVNEKHTEKDYTQYFDVTAWEKLGDLCKQYLAKGSKVMVLGKAFCIPYVGKDQKAHGNVGIMAQSVEFLTRPQKKEDNVVEAAAQAMANDLSYDDIPY